jgi:hypothetical protein
MLGLLGFSATFAVGCAGSNKKAPEEHKNDIVYKAAAAERAEFDLGCPSESVTTQVLGGGGNTMLATIGVTGCGHKASYICKCDGGAGVFGALICNSAICSLDGTSTPAAGTPAAAPVAPAPAAEPAPAADPEVAP